LIPIESDMLSADLPSAGRGAPRPFPHGSTLVEAPTSVSAVG
jgi:hypothetical protein